jgi:hypothetical protein
MQLPGLAATKNGYFAAYLFLFSTDVSRTRVTHSLSDDATAMRHS